MALLRCLSKQLKAFESEPSPFCDARPVDPSQDMFNWTGFIRGPDGSPFQGGTFNLKIRFPTDFPFKPPRIQFTTRVYHPNISPQGDICLDILHDKWSPALSLRSVLMSLCSLLTDPNPEHGLDNEILNVYRTNRKLYEENAREWTKKYAMGNQEELEA